MSARKRATPSAHIAPTVFQRALETLLFIAASVVGVYGIGQGLAGVYQPGQPINLAWLAVTGIAVFVLFAQMGRVQDTWIHKPTKIRKNAAEPDERQSTAEPDASGPHDRGGKSGR